MPRRIENIVNMNLLKMSIVSQHELDSQELVDVFSPHSSHIYFICRRPRIYYDHNKSKVNNDKLNLVVKINNNGVESEREVIIDNYKKEKDKVIKIQSEYPKQDLNFSIKMKS